MPRSSPSRRTTSWIRANAGVLWFRVHVRGAPVHVREAGAGANAIEASFGLIQALRKLEAEWNTRKGAYRHFENLDHPINFNVGKIAGGDWASSVPAWCSFDCRIAMFPGVSAREAASEIEDCIRVAARSDPFLANAPPEIEWNGFFAEGYTLEEGRRPRRRWRAPMRGPTGRRSKSMVTPGYLDGRVFALYAGMPCLVYGPVSQNIHGFDERVSLASVKRVTGTIALFIAEWCGLERAS
jgi:acetylornithine deacetylase